MKIVNIVLNNKKKYLYHFHLFIYYDRKSLQQSEDSGFTSDDLHPSSGNSGENINTPPNSTNQKQFRAQGQVKKPVSIDSNLGHETDYSLSK